MASAVAEAHRVLRPGGVLLDLHPLPQPLRLEVWTARPGPVDLTAGDPANFDRAPLGDLAPSDTLDDFRAASAALAGAEALGFTAPQVVGFEYRYLFDNLDELTDFLEENEELDLAADDLLERALLALQATPRPARLALIQSVEARRLVKPAAP
jgi:SAM-dependent methyltransferase